MGISAGKEIIFRLLLKFRFQMSLQYVASFVYVHEICNQKNWYRTLCDRENLLFVHWTEGGTEYLSLSCGMRMQNLERDLNIHIHDKYRYHEAIMKEITMLIYVKLVVGDWFIFYIEMYEIVIK